MRYILIVFALILCTSCGDDYIEKGIEGQWQMTDMEIPDGTTVKIDTIFYSFKKDVFRYLTLKTEINSVNYMGMYSEKNDSLYVDIRTDLSNNFSDWGENVHSRGFKVERRKSTRMTLNHRDTLYHFKKY